MSKDFEAMKPGKLANTQRIRLWASSAKGQEISKTNYGFKLLPKNKPNSLSWKVNTKRESIFFLQKDKLSFVLTLKY